MKDMFRARFFELGWGIQHSTNGIFWKDIGPRVWRCKEDAVRVAVNLNNGIAPPEWHEDPDGGWFTGCGNAFEFGTGGPEENGFKFCPYCGAEIRAFKVEEENE